MAIGVFECALHPTISSVIGDTVPAEKLRMRYASARTASGLGRVIGPALGAALALWSLSAVFIGCGISLLCAAVLIISTLPETRLSNADPSGAAREDDDEEGLSTLLPAFRDRRLAALLLWFAIIEIVSGWPEFITPPYARETDALSASGIGLLFTYAAVVGVILQWPISKLTAKVPTISLLMAAGVAVTGGFGLLLIHPNSITLYASATLLSVAQVLFGPLVPVTVNAMAPPAARASYMAAISTVNDLEDTAGPASGMYLYSLSPRLPWLVGMPIVLLAALALGMSIRRSERSGSPAGIPDRAHVRVPPGA
jgi:predicted MFS family arabinose efflux permease